MSVRRHGHVTCPKSLEIRLKAARAVCFYLEPVLRIVIVTAGKHELRIRGTGVQSQKAEYLAFTIFAFWGFRHQGIYVLGGGIVNPLDLAVLAVAFAGACAGFLWWNAAPARIFMGDVGALGIGSALALLALTTNTHLLLPLVCGLNVMEILSVAAQMGTYKFLDKRRIFKMSPVHHHFELSGWPETTVIIRFWIISGISVATALALYYADFARITGQA